MGGHGARRIRLARKRNAEDSYGTRKIHKTPLKELGDPELLRICRLLQISDHYYWMSTKGWSAGYVPDRDVHSYFFPYDTPWEAYNTYINVLNALAEEVFRRKKNKPRRRKSLHKDN